jgi:DUF1680 family protein
MENRGIRKSPHARLGELPQGAAVWTGGFWKNRFDACKDLMVPNIYRIFADDSLSHGFANFRIAAGDEEGSHRGPPFTDGDIYKWLEGAAWIYGVCGGGELKKQIDAAAALILRVQREDGYIFTPQGILERQGRRQGRAGGALTNSLNFEVYNLGHLITAGCVHHRATGEGELLGAAKKAALYLEGIFNGGMKGKAKTAICPSHYMALIDLYRCTADRRFLETARKAIALRDEVEQGTDDNQDRLPLRSQREILGHAVRATYLYAGVADLYAETGDPSLPDLLNALWEDETRGKIYINAGVGALYDGVSPSGYAGDHKDLARTHQSFGRPYELPNISAYNETCAAVGNVLWSWRMFLLNADPRCADLIERTFYNLILASVSLDGKNYFYSNPLRREGEKLPYFLKWPRTREPYLSSFCCPPNMMRILAESSSFCYGVSEDTVYTGIYGESRARIELSPGRGFTLFQKTDYPWDGNIVLRFEDIDGGGVDCTLQARVPSWVRAGSLSAPGGVSRRIGPGDADTFIPLSGRWKSGDEVRIDFPLEAALYLGHPLIEETNHHGAVMRGPLLYCAEGCDNPGGGWHTLGLKAGAVFQEKPFETGGLSLRALETGDALCYDQGEWGEGAIYKQAGRLETRRRTLSLIPYFAWDNRAYSAMKIWFPLYFGGPGPEALFMGGK